MATRTSLVALLLKRVRFLGSFDDLDLTASVTASAVSDFPDSAQAHRDRASYLSAVHEFEPALAELLRAEELGAKHIASARSWLRLAQGRDVQLLLKPARKGATRPSPTSLSLLAAVEAALGQFDQADEHYQAALDAIVDVSPFVFSQILFQRGVMWAELAGDSKRAMPLYAEALRLLPQYVNANVHFAELQAEAGDLAGAIERLRSFVARTADPEPKAVLAELLKRAGRPGADELKAAAHASYQSLLKKHRAAFLDHASEFYSGAGAEPERALLLAQENHARREGARPRSLVISAAHAASKPAQGCAVAAASGQWAANSPSLRQVIAQHSARCDSPPKL